MARSRFFYGSQELKPYLPTPEMQEVWKKCKSIDRSAFPDIDTQPLHPENAATPVTTQAEHPKMTLVNKK